MQHYPGWDAEPHEFMDIGMERYAVVYITSANNPARRIYFRVSNGPWTMTTTGRHSYFRGSRIFPTARFFSRCAIASLEFPAHESVQSDRRRVPARFILRDTQRVRQVKRSGA